MIHKDMRLIPWMFQTSTLVVSRGSLITMPAFVRRAMDDSVDMTEDCIGMVVAIFGYYSA